jgi:arylformamidase
MLVSTDWEGGFGLPADAVKGGVALSGMYDLEPVRLSHRNTYLKLDAAAARRNSPIHHIPPRPIPLIVGHGDGELDEFKRQSRDYAAAWHARGYPCTPIEFKGLNHFEVCFEYAHPESELFAAMRAMMGLGGR